MNESLGKFERKEQFEELRNTSAEDSDVFMISLADKLANIIDMLKAKKSEGISFWSKLNNSDSVKQH